MTKIGPEGVEYESFFRHPMKAPPRYWRRVRVEKAGRRWHWWYRLMVWDR